MVKTGETIKFCDRDAIVLTCSEKEVLLLIGKKYVQWVDLDLIEMINKRAQT